MCSTVCLATCDLSSPEVIPIFLSRGWLLEISMIYIYFFCVISASCSADLTVKIWDFQDNVWACMKTLHGKFLTSFVLHPCIMAIMSHYTADVVHWRQSRKASPRATGICGGSFFHLAFDRSQNSRNQWFRGWGGGDVDLQTV
jgi:hypothetical protein